MKTILAFICIHISFIACCQFSFRIDGTAPSSLNGKELILTISDRYSKQPFETTIVTIVKENKFFFQGKINKYSEWGYITMGKGQLLYLVVDTGISKMHILPTSKNSKTYKNKLSNTNIVNSPSNVLLKQIGDSISSYYIRFGRKGSQNNIIDISPDKRRELNLLQLKLLKQNPTFFYSLVHLYRLPIDMLENYSILLETFNSFSKNIRASPLGKEYGEKLQLAKSTAAGNPVPQFTAKTNNDSTFFNNLLSGKNYLLIFGATWCGPCKTYYPALQKMHDKYSLKGLKFVSVNLHDDKQEWLKQISLYKQNWTHVSELVKWNKSAISYLFNVRALPKYILVSNNGIILYNSDQIDDPDFEKLENIINDLD